ncbi:MAG: hypothetical protein ACFCD0_20695 [Gemmataceae bacterium]
MRRVILVLLGLLELGVALVLLQLGRTLPTRAKLRSDFAKAQQVTKDASAEIRQVKAQVASLRQKQVKQLVQKLNSQLELLTVMLKDQSLHLKGHFETAKTIRDEMETLAKGAEGIEKTLDPSQFKALGNGLGVVAKLLEEDLPPASNKAAQQLSDASTALSNNAKFVSELVSSLPTDLKALEQVHDSLGKFESGLGKMTTTLKVDRLKTMRKGFQGMHASLDTGADQVARLARFTYPVVTFDGFRPEIEKRKFWPEGRTIAGGLRKAGEGVKAADEQLGDMIANLPELIKSVEESRQVMKATRETLARALKHKDKLEPILQKLPNQTLQLAEKVPMVAKDLAAVLRKTEELTKVGAQLREARKGLDDTAENLEPIRKAVKSSARLFRTTRVELDKAINQREQAEKLMAQTTDLSDGLSQVLPHGAESLMNQLKVQEMSLDQLANSMEEVGDIIPKQGETMAEIVETGRWLVWLVAACVLIHSLYTFAGVREQRTDNREQKTTVAS